MRGRRGQAIAAAAVAALLLVGATGCGGSSSDGASGSEGSPQTTQASGSDDGGDTGSGSTDAPNPCELVSIEKASEILGGDAADPVFTGNDTGSGSTSCAWQTQAGKDDPTIDGAGHILTLNVTTPPESMSMDEFWATTKGAGGKATTVDGCDEAFWIGGILNALKGDVYLTGSAGLADDSPDAKASTEDLVAAACASA